MHYSIMQFIVTALHQAQAHWWLSLFVLRPWVVDSTWTLKIELKKDAAENPGK